MEYIIRLAIDYFPPISWYTTAAAALVLATVKIHSFYIKTTAHHAEVPSIKDLLEHIDKGLATLNNVLLEKNIISHSCYSGNRSPRTINALGTQLMKESGAEIIFHAQKERLAAELAAKHAASLLQLEREALNVMIAHRDDPAFLPLQDFVYRHPMFDGTPLTYTDLLFVMALILRDYCSTPDSAPEYPATSPSGRTQA